RGRRRSPRPPRGWRTRGGCGRGGRWWRNLTLSTRRVATMHAHGRHTTPVHRDDLQFPAWKRSAVADVRHPSQFGEGIATERRPVSLGNGDVIVAADVDE